MNFHWNYSEAIIYIFKVIINTVPEYSSVRIVKTVFWVRISFLCNFWSLFYLKFRYH